MTKASEQYRQYKEWSTKIGYPVRSYNSFCHIRQFFNENQIINDRHATDQDGAVRPDVKLPSGEEYEISFGNTLLCEVPYEICQLVAKKEQVYTTNGKYMFSVSMTDRAKSLLDNDGWEIRKESWLDYRQRTEAERELEKQKQYKFAADLADAFNRMHANSVRPEVKLPSEKEYDFDPWTNGWNACLAEIKRLNRID